MKITDEMLYRHAAEARDIWLDTLPKDDELPEHQFSDEFMASLEALEVQEKAQHKKKSRSPLRRVAAVFLTVLIGTSTWLGVDTKARAAFVSWFREFVGDSVVYTYVGKTPQKDIADYHCAWLPDGYRARELSWGSHSRTISCLKGEDHIRLDYAVQDGKSAENVFGIDEYVERKTVTVSGQEAILYLNTDEDEHSLVWVDEEVGIVFCLEATEDAEIMLQVAETVSSAK